MGAEGHVTLRVAADPGRTATISPSAGFCPIVPSLAVIVTVPIL